MKFTATHIVFGKVINFTEETAPDWLTCKNVIKGSTADDSWFWKLHVLTLDVGESVKTDWHIISRED